MALRRHHGGPMRAFGVEVDQGKRPLRRRPALYTAQDYEVEPDASGASYLWRRRP